jgi:5-methylcytosine-specific restriction enzyme subunit McrC
MLYASDLAQFRGTAPSLFERDAEHLPDLVAELLSAAVDERVRRHLTCGSRERRGDLTRIRGRIDFLRTEAHGLLSHGKVACAYREIIVDTARNRLVRAALEQSAAIVGSGRLRSKCRAQAALLRRLGVSRSRPTRWELGSDVISRNEASDLLMVSLARLAFDLALPLEDSGLVPMFEPDREETWVRKLFEKSVLGFAKLHLQPLGWTVSGNMPLDWPVVAGSAGASRLLPGMITDIVLTPPSAASKVIIDTKFTSIVAPGRYGKATFKSAHLYQLYAYLRSQEHEAKDWSGAAGVLLYPAVETSVDEYIAMNRHRIRFVTVDLSEPTRQIRDRLLMILQTEYPPLNPAPSGIQLGMTAIRR